MGAVLQCSTFQDYSIAHPGLLNGGNLADVIGKDLGERLKELGIDASRFDGGQIEELQNLMHDSGIDLSALNETQLSNLIVSVRENGGIDGLDLTHFLDRGSN